ncbi:MAG: beta-propeller fold lactonase family protein [Acidobacteria bacterium]|nr:beta-propeller fold lactonase family protein [Acidobacteriota bacterium]
MPSAFSGWLFMDVRLAKRSVLAGAALVVLCLAAAAARAQGQSSRCNAPMSDAVSYVQLPGHPFSTVSTPDGCWLFVSVSSSNPKSSNGVAVLSREGGRITLKRVVQVETGPTGMTLTHDGKLLVAADDEYVVFLDAAQLISGRGDAILGYIKDADFAGSVYVNTTSDDKFLFVSDENVATVTVINLELARAEGFKQTAIVGKIPVGEAPIALTFSPDGRWLYTTSEIAAESFGWAVECKPEGQDPATAKPRYPQGAIIVVDVQKAQTDPANSVVSRVPAGCSPVRMVIAPDGSRVYVTARNNNALLAFDTAKLRAGASDARVGNVPVGSAPVGAAIVNDGRQVVVTNSNRFARDQTARQTLTVIDAARVGDGAAAILGSVPAGVFPREFGRSPDGRTLYVANYISSELEIIDLKRLPVQRATAAR